MVDFTVVIPTYNGADRLPKLLERLRSQVNGDRFSWEILVVDNNSTDHTADLVQTYQADQAHPPIKYLFEARQGAAFARQKAMECAQSEWVGFLDDDVLPASDWVINAFEFGQSRPQVGVYGGQIHAEFEVPPPPNFKRIQAFLAIRERGPQPHPYQPDRLILPPSAAWVVRRRAWLEHVPPHPTLGGRTGKFVLQGDDYEPLLYLHKAGWEIWYNPAMHAYHQIPKRRLERESLLSLSRGCGLCTCQLRLITAKPYQTPIIMLRVMLGGLRRSIRHVIRYRGKVKTDLIAACELEFHLSTALSPFYLSRLANRKERHLIESSSLL